jgi:Holliday junction DNA helicase RuvB
MILYFGLTITIKNKDLKIGEYIMANGLRPTKFEEIIGQQDVVNRLRISTLGCKNSGTVLPHVLIDGPPGLGKTTIASALASEMDVNLYIANAANLRSVKTVISYLMRINKRCVFFIDEIHRLPKLVEEFLYPVMEDFKFTIVLDKEPEEIEVPAFTLVGATTSGGSLSQPFYDRFQIKEHLNFYTENELAKLARSNADKLGLNINDEELLEIAKRSKGTPRILNGRLQWYKNYKSCMDDNATVDEIFQLQGIDNMGMDSYDRAYLDILKQNRGNPLGLKSISSLTGIAIDTIENSVEPYLVRKGFVRRTQKGRILGHV